jgi:hypothetical protein
MPMRVWRSVVAVAWGVVVVVAGPMHRLRPYRMAAAGRPATACWLAACSH